MRQAGRLSEFSFPPVLGVFSDEETASIADGAETAEDGQPKEMADLSREVALLKTQVSGLQYQMRELSRVAKVENSAAEEMPANDPSNDPAARAEAERRRQEQMEALEANF